MHFWMNMLDSEPMMYSRAREASIISNTKEETTNGHTNILSHKKRTQIEIP